MSSCTIATRRRWVFGAAAVCIAVGCVSTDSKTTSMYGPVTGDKDAARVFEGGRDLCDTGLHR
jgi:hypothetical protein